MNARARYGLQEVFFIILYWMGAANLYVLIRYSGVENLHEDAIYVKYIWLFATLAGLIIGGILGLLEIFIYPKFIKKKSFGLNVLYRATLFLLLIIMSVVSIALATYSQQGYGLHKAVQLCLDYFMSGSFVSLLLFMMVILALLDLGLLINRRSGPGVIFNMLKGKYHRPREEDRIFMFLDLQSSSALAEKMGHVNFSMLLQTCFRDLSDLLLTYEASVYQFVGDEAVLSWPSQKGLENYNCIRFFFEFDALLEKRHDYYLSQYNHRPVFKALLNRGIVTVAEVGDIKSEIAYHGEVLNTAARVQALCNVYNKKILLTKSMVDGLKHQQALNIQYIDAVQLRGKEKKENIYTVDMIT